jgi:hypothetical protein
MFDDDAVVDRNLMKTQSASKVAIILLALVSLEATLAPASLATGKADVPRIKKLISKPAATPAQLRNEDIDSLSNDIMAKELDLLKLNSNLKLHQIATPWAGRRWWVFNMGGVGLTAIGAYINGCTRFAYLKKNRINKVPKYQLPDATICRVTANAIMVGGGIVEELALGWKDWKDKRDGVNLPVMRKYADSVQNDVDAMLVRREALIAALPPESNERRLYEAEGKVLRDVRDLGVNEFVRYYADSKSATAFFRTSYAWAALSNALAMSGGIVGYQASLTRRGTARQRTLRGGYGGIADIISGSMNQATPLVVRLAAHVAESGAKRKLCKDLDCKEPIQLDSLHEDQEKLHQLVASNAQMSVHGTVLRDNVLAKTTQVFDEHEKLRLGDVKAKKRRLVSQTIFFTGIGMPKTVNGIGTAVASYKYTDAAHKQSAFRTIGYTATTYGVGYSVAMAELIRNQLMNEIRSSKAKKAGTSSGQILKREIGELEQLSEAIEKNNTGPLRPPIGLLPESDTSDAPRTADSSEASTTVFAKPVLTSESGILSSN